MDVRVGDKLIMKKKYIFLSRSGIERSTYLFFFQ